MRRLVLFLISIALFTFCDSESNNPYVDRPEFSVVQTNSVGCTKQLAKTNSSTDIDWSFDKKTSRLQLAFGFESNCCSVYKNSSSFDAGKNELSITLIDSTIAPCRCVCPWEEEFEFKITNTDQIKLMLLIKFYDQDYYSAMLDTVLTLK